MRGKTELVGIGVGCVLLCALRVDASSISIINIDENETFFHTKVSGSVGILPDIHFLVDIPGTPWESSSTIIEAASPGPLLPDVLRVSWTMEHLVGPDPEDINPNPLGPTTLALTFKPTAAGPFGGPTVGFPSSACRPGGIFTLVSVAHPLTTGGSHFDDFCLEVFGNVSLNILGTLSIDSYTIDYYAIHCVNLDPTGFGCLPTAFPSGGAGGMAEAPEPATLVLLGSGLMVQARRNLRRIRPRSRTRGGR